MLSVHTFDLHPPAPPPPPSQKIDPHQVNINSILKNDVYITNIYRPFIPPVTDPDTAHLILTSIYLPNHMIMN